MYIYVVFVRLFVCVIIRNVRVNSVPDASPIETLKFFVNSHPDMSSLRGSHFLSSTTIVDDDDDDDAFVIVTKTRNTKIFIIFEYLKKNKKNTNETPYIIQSEERERERALFC